MILLFHYNPKVGNCVIAPQSSDTAYAPNVSLIAVKLTLHTSCYLWPLNPYKLQAEEKNSWFKLMTTQSFTQLMCVVLSLNVFREV